MIIELDKEYVQLLGHERPMTKAEREVIQNALDLKKKKKLLVSAYLFYLFLALFSGILLSYFSFIKEAIITFISFNLIFAFVVIYARYPLKKLLRQEVIYVREGIFITINKYYYAEFEINNNGKRESLFINAMSGDSKPIRKGDKVIIVKVRRKFAYIYHPRE